MDRLYGCALAFVVEGKHGRVLVAGWIVGHHWNLSFGAFDGGENVNAAAAEEFQSLDDRVRLTPADRLVFQGTRNIVGSTTGATPNVTETTADPIKTTEAYTPKAVSDEIRRSRIALRRYKTVGENRVMFFFPNRVLRIETMLSNNRSGSFDTIAADPLRDVGLKMLTQQTTKSFEEPILHRRFPNQQALPALCR